MKLACLFVLWNGVKIEIIWHVERYMKEKIEIDSEGLFHYHIDINDINGHVFAL